MEDCSALSVAFSQLNYSDNLSVYSKMEQLVQSEIHPLPRLNNTSSLSINCMSLHFPDIKVPVIEATEEDVTSIVSAANQCKHTRENLLSLFNNLAKKFSTSSKNIFYAETMSMGRPIKELEQIDLKRILKLIDQEIVYYSLQSLEKKTTLHISTQIEADKGDIVSLFHRLFSCLREGSVVLTCLGKSPRSITCFQIANTLLNCNKCTGLISFLPITHSIYLSKIGQIDCIEPDNDLLMKSAITCGRLYSDESHSCAVVLDSADIESAAQACLDSITYSSGMTKLSPHLALVQEPVFDQFRTSLQILAQKNLCQDPSTSNCLLGPLPSQADFDYLQKHLNKSVENDGMIMGKELPRNKSVFPALGVNPLILEGVQPASTLFQSLPRGPYICLIPFRTLKEAATIANRLPNEREVLLVWTDVVAQAMETLDLFNFNYLGVNCSSLDIDVIPAQLSKRIRIATQASCLTDVKTLTSDSLKSALATASKAQPIWSKRTSIQRNIIIQKAISGIDALKHSDFLTTLQSRLVSVNHISNYSTSFAGCKTMNTFKARGLILIILNSTILNDEIFGLLISALSVGNSLVVTCSASEKETVASWKDVLTSNGLDEDAIQFICGDLSEDLLKSVLSVRCVDLVMTFGLNLWFTTPLRSLFAAAAPTVFVDHSIEVFSRSAFCLENMLPWIRQEKVIFLSSGDIFAN